MAILIIIASVVLWIGAIATLWVRPVVSPVLSFLGLLCISFAKTGASTIGGPFPLIPMNSSVLMSWLCMTVVVVGATVMQAPERLKSDGSMPYLVAGSIVGLAVGLLGFSFSSHMSVLYACMVIAVAAGTFFGWISYSNTPRGRMNYGEGSKGIQNLLAKGFPVAITVMQMGVPLVILTARYALR